MNLSELSIRSGLSVSHETFRRLEIFVQLLRKWNSKINLIARSTEDQVWTRHILDSAQVAKAAERRGDGGAWLDLGSGGGFPGLVIAVLRHDHEGDQSFTLVESDSRKCAFLVEASRELSLNVTIMNTRIEDLGAVKCDVLTARALAPLDKLLELAYPALHANTHAYFLKGERVLEEVELAKKRWDFRYRLTQSITSEQGWLLELDGIKHAK